MIVESTHSNRLARSAGLNAEGDAAPSLPTRRRARETGPTPEETIEEGAT
jgi:hypothetical protein